MAENCKCSHCNKDVAPRAPRYDDAILFVCDEVPCQHALEEARQSTLAAQQAKRRKKDVWAEAAELLAPKAIEKPQADPVPDNGGNNDVEEQKESDELDLEMELIDADPFDDAPINRRRGFGRPYFQRYQFYLPVRGGGRQRRTIDAFDPGQRPGHSPVLDYVPEAVGLFLTGGIADAAQSMSKGFSVEHLSKKFDYLHVPRQPSPQTAWVFDEVRFKDFIVRKIDDKAVAYFEQNPNEDPENESELKKLAHAFGLSLKAFFNLYHFFRIGYSDKGFMEEPDLKIPRGLWTSETSRQRHRSRLMEEGAALYGTPDHPVPLQDQERTNRLWPVFEKVRKEISK
jgi:hypothetical protein